MTLRHQVSLILLFGQPVGLDEYNLRTSFRHLALRHRLSAVLLFSAVWQSGHKPTRDGRPMTLRRYVSIALLLFPSNFIIAPTGQGFQYMITLV